MPTPLQAERLDGAAVAAEIRAEVAVALRGWSGSQPGLAVVLAGDNAASQVYVRNKVKACAELGLRSETLQPPADIDTAGMLTLVAELNARADVDGILVQLPLPPQIDAQAVLLAVDPAKDVDGFHPMNLGKLVSGRAGLTPCTPAGILELLRRRHVAVAGRRAVVVGRSDIVGKPLALLLLREHATVTICHSRTPDLAAVCQEAELLFAAIGRAGMIGTAHIRPGAVVIDVGINRIGDRAEVERFYPGDGPCDGARLAEFERRGATLVGDVDPVAAWRLASAFTPVPGGVGPLTIAMLMANTLTAARDRRA